MQCCFVTRLPLIRVSTGSSDATAFHGMNENKYIVVHIARPRIKLYNLQSESERDKCMDDVVR